jgi:polyhydroxyalkanoate synthase
LYNTQLGEHPKKLADLIANQAINRYQYFLQGVRSYQQHPYYRKQPVCQVVATESTSQVIYYPAASPRAVLFWIPSLVNRGYILDLQPSNSFLRQLAGHGFSSLLLEWGDPTKLEYSFGLNEYMARLLRLLSQALPRFLTQPIYAAGYCMGGLFALAAAQLTSCFKGVISLATPWDFKVSQAPLTKVIQSHWPRWQRLLPAGQPVPVELLQWYFSALDPQQILQKFIKFAKTPLQSAVAEQFVALEDWLNDGVALPQNVLNECLQNWYQLNQPMLGKWQILGQIIQPQSHKTPILAVIPTQDRIVPPASAVALAENARFVTLRHIEAGHIGMVTSTRAAPQTIQAITDWLGDNN